MVKPTSKPDITPTKINKKLQETPVAIIGMSSIFPESRNLQEYWDIITRKIDCITDVPPSRWSIKEYFDPDPTVPDKTYCKRGGFIPDIDFNPLEFGLPPNLLEVTDISQLLALVVAKEAIEDAGYGDSKTFDRDRAGVILGVALARQLSVPLAARLQYPIWEKALKSYGVSDQDTANIIEKIKSAYVNWEPNAFPGMLANIVAGRIANRFDLGGTNCVVDAACASSLGALSMAVNELVEGHSDMMITGGVDTDNSILAYMCFSKTPAVSKSENSKPFDAESDGMMLGEGMGLLVLKRLEDAERDRDRVYAVIKGIGTSSDGGNTSIYAPRPEGQMKALERAYEQAGFSPNTVGLIEAHGTGTMAGDPAEFKALNAVFTQNNTKTQTVALGSVKSQIGHTKAAAGAASLIKTALSLYHKILPPTINVTTPNPKLKLESSPFYLNTETRPWLKKGDIPRRAGISSFGFGGTNYHIVMEEYQAEHTQAYRLHSTPEMLLLQAPTSEKLWLKCVNLLEHLNSKEGEKHYQEWVKESRNLVIPVNASRLGFVSGSCKEACQKLEVSLNWLKKQPDAQTWHHPQGIFYHQAGKNLQGKIVALFSGQGSQYLEMGRELLLNFPNLRQVYTEMDHLFSETGLPPISETVFPMPVFDPKQREIQTQQLQRTEFAQPAIGAFSAGLYKLLQQSGFKPDFVAGHSFGELTALWAAGALQDEDYYRLVKARGEAMATPKGSQGDNGTMLAVKGNANKVAEIVAQFPAVSIANFNSDQQVVLAGAKPAIAEVKQVLSEQGFSAISLPVSAAFHTSLVEYAQKPFAKAVEGLKFQKPHIPVYSNVTSKPYPKDPTDIRKILKEQMINQVLFKEEIENIYRDGGYCFVEFGPRNVLTNLVKEILGNRDHLAIALNASSKKDSDYQLREAVLQLRVAGLALQNLDPYPLELKIPQPKKKATLSIRLNASNYISDKTKSVMAQGQKSQPQLVSQSSSSSRYRGETMTAPPPKALTNGHSKKATVLPLHTSSIASKPMVDNSQTQPKSQSNGHTNGHKKIESPNYQRVLNSLELSLEKFSQHSRESLQVHSQYLNHSIESGQVFLQLVQHQNLCLNNSLGDKSQTAVVQSSERSMAKFHEYQTETLRVHDQYLHHQLEYAHNFFQLTHQGYAQLVKGDRDLFADSLTLTLSSSPTKSTPVTADNSVMEQKPPVAFTPEPTPEPVAFTPEPTPEIEKQPPLESELVVNSLEMTVGAWEETLSPAIDLDNLSGILLDVVSDKTGYPVEMLEIDMDMEADLGIDSIKRVEILGALQEQLPHLPPVNLEELAEHRTLSQIVDYMKSFASQPELAMSIEPSEHDAASNGNGNGHGRQGIETLEILQTETEKKNMIASSLS